MFLLLISVGVFETVPLDDRMRQRRQLSIRMGNVTFWPQILVFDSYRFHLQFHLACVGLKQPPAEKWYCAVCAKDKGLTSSVATTRKGRRR